MRKWWRLCGCLLFFTVLASKTYSKEVDVDDLIYMTEEYPPFNYTENNVLKGVSIELLKHIWREMGYAEQPVAVYPWARGFNHLKYDENHVLFATSRTPPRETLFKWVGPIYLTKFVLFGLKDKTITIDSFADIQKYTVGTLRDDVAEDLLLELGYPEEKLQPVSSLGNNIQKLLRGRIDLIAYSECGFERAMAGGENDPNLFSIVFTYKEIGSYYAFGKSVPDSLISRFQAAFDKLEPQRRTIMRHYFSDYESCR